MTISSKRFVGFFLAGVGLFALAGCQSESDIATVELPANTATTVPTQAANAPAATRAPTPQPLSTAAPQPTFPAPPELDTSQRSVELQDIIFDTFDGSSTPLSDADSELIERLRDAIKPVYVAKYENPGDDDWLEDQDFVVGYVAHESGQAYAYPVKFLNFHELVNDVIDDVPLIVTYCPLCGSGVVFDRRVDDEVLVFGNTSALYNSDLVMFDHSTGSYWFQTGGEAVVGELTGEQLKPLASFFMDWGEWLELHPITKVLSRDQGLGGQPDRYLRNPFSTYAEYLNAGDNRYPFPVDETLVGNRLRPSEIVVAVAINDVERAYSPGRIGNAAINDQIEVVPVVVFSREDRQIATVFSPVLEWDGRKLEFEFTNGSYEDLQTGSVWNLAGVAISGELEGSRLTPLPSRRAFWFSISVSNQDIEIYGER